MSGAVATRDVDISQAAVLAQVLRQPIDDEGGRRPAGLTWSAPTAVPSKTEGHRLDCRSGRLGPAAVG
jgi:hypothetical protein